MASYIGIVELIPIGTGLGCASFEADSRDRVMISIQLGAMYASERSGTQSFWREFQVIFSVTKSIGTSIRVRFQLLGIRVVVLTAHRPELTGAASSFLIGPRLVLDR
jgi:hypothetical protein